MFDYDIAVLTGLVSKEIEKSLLDNNIKFNTADKHWQLMLLKGLNENNVSGINVFSAQFVPDFTKSKILKVNKKEEFGIKYIGFNNLKYYKILSRKKNIIKALKTWAETDNQKQKVLIVYSMDSAFLKAMDKIKKRFPKIITVLIVLDLPEYMNLEANVSPIYKLLKKIDKISISSCLKSVERYVLLTKHMVEKFNTNDYVIINGMVEKSDCIEDCKECIESKKFSIVYTGSLFEKFGVKTLIDAMDYIDDINIELNICGYGELEKYIKAKAEIDKRIKFHGQVPLDKAIELQKSSSLLVNPRPNKGEYIKYSFPSKMFEYLMTGVPLLCYKLDCYGDDFDDLFNYIDGESAKHMAEKIMEIKSNYGYYSNKAIFNRSKVLDQFNYYEQVKKILAD